MDPLTTALVLAIIVGVVLLVAKAGIGWVLGLALATFLVVGFVGPRIAAAYNAPLSPSTSQPVDVDATVEARVRATQEALRDTAEVIVVETQTSDEVGAGICRNTPGNEDTGSRTLVVPEGHQLNIEWWYDGWADDVRSILPPGTYTPKAGVNLGAWWDYADCTKEYVLNQSGSNHDWTEGFTKS